MTDQADEDAIPPAVMFTAFEAHFSGGDTRKLLPYDALMVRQTARAIMAETERCRAIANERAAQLWAAIQMPLTDETKAGWAGQMIEALTIEQRISQGHTPRDTINIEGLHKAAEEAGFVHANT